MLDSIPMPLQKAKSKHLLIIHCDDVPPNAVARVRRNLTAIGISDPEQRLFPVEIPAQTAALRALAAQCNAEGALVWLLAERDDCATESADSYKPLSECSERYASALDSWRSGDGPIPELKVGEMVRL